MNDPQYLIPADEADPSAEPHALTAAVALAELRDALAGWIADGLEKADGRVHDPDRANVDQITNSLYLAATLYQKVKEHQDTVDEALAARMVRAGRHLQYAAEQADTGRRIATRGDDPYPYNPAAAPGFIRTHYGSAVAYVRQASDFLHDGPRVVTAVATRTRCAGGEMGWPCSHGRQEAHLVPEAGSCEARRVGDAPCEGALDAVIIRDRILGARKQDDDDRGCRACVLHGSMLLRALDRHARWVYPGPGNYTDYPDRNHGGAAVDVYNRARGAE
ncbi:hypothetical protein [Streptomyces sp. NPDC049879]|uniref:hypothetical protein n=1 Tax=Streptomyces sp. NPDC049879 TaxID=3365598 RepID=UPI0037BC12AE